MRVVWFRHSGIVSIFRPKEGTAHECSMSSEETNSCTVISIGNMT